MDRTTLPAETLELTRIGLTVADVPSACAFFQDALGFAQTEPDWPYNNTVFLQLGGQVLEVTGYDPPGRPYPQPRAANEPWFQHFAIAVSDMQAAYERLSRFGSAPISLGGPQRLPVSAGSVTAYKFRDPDGHPLELAHIPGAVFDPSLAAGPFLGINHVALAVRDIEASLAFYVGVLGFEPGRREVFSGPEQDRLDGLDNVDLEIVVLTAQAGPHIELLHYRSPEPEAKPIDLHPADIAATRLTVRAHDLKAVNAVLAQAGVRTNVFRGGLLIRDPDGHMVQLIR